MEKVIHVDFKKHELLNEYNADVYTTDIKKYQFNVIATSINEAYYVVLTQAGHHNINTIRCVAVYSGKSEKRTRNHSPIKVWQQNGTEMLIRRC